jgi:hypothetical protein
LAFHLRAGKAVAGTNKLNGKCPRVALLHDSKQGAEFIEAAAGRILPRGVRQDVQRAHCQREVLS